DLLLQHTGKLGVGDLPPVLDMETNDGQSDATVIARAKTWLAHVHSVTGRTPIIYSSPGYWSSIGNPNLSQYILWVAHWQTQCPTTPSGWTSWDFWQTADNGSVPGISGAVDLDLFNGTKAALDALAAPPKPPADMAITKDKTVP